MKIGSYTILWFLLGEKRCWNEKVWKQVKNSGMWTTLFFKSPYCVVAGGKRRYAKWWQNLAFLTPRITVSEPIKEEHNGRHWSVHLDLGVGWPSSAEIATSLGFGGLGVYLLGKLWAFCKARFFLWTLRPVCLAVPSSSALPFCVWSVHACL